MESSIKRLDTEADGSGKFGMGDQKFRDLPRRDLPNIDLTVSLEGAARLQDRHPLDSIDVTADFFSRRQKEMVFDVENTRGVVGAFEKPPNPNEITNSLVSHAPVDNPLHDIEAGT